MKGNIRANADDWTVLRPQKRKSKVKTKRENLLRRFCNNNCPHADNPNACDCKEFKEYSKMINKRRRRIVTDNTCVCCGVIIPEGTQICPNCGGGYNEKGKTKRVVEIVP